MILLLERQKSMENCTIGELFVDGKFQCHTLEDVVRDFKIKGQTAIPAGVYEVLITYSPRFKRFLPEVLNVPNYDGIRIHPGNTAVDTEGCILPGTWEGGGRVNNSGYAFAGLVLELNRAVQTGQKITIDIRNHHEQ